MSVRERYKRWCQEDSLEDFLKEELNSRKDDEVWMEDAFSRDLSFGTSGLRGIMGAGTNRINGPMVEKVTQGIANYMNENMETPSIAISYDSRNGSKDFAKKVAQVMGGNKIQVYIYSQLMPVSALSFAIRELNCDMGVMITASHNPRKYNGYKVYNGKGAQIIDEVQEIYEEIEKIDPFKDVVKDSFEEVMDKYGQYISKELEEKYLNRILEASLSGEEESSFHIIYTPLNGTGAKPVQRVLKEAGIPKVSVVKEQENPDGDFPTCPYPNPELGEAYNLAFIKLKEQEADFILATDPDCDRVGIGLLEKGKETILSGNQIGILLFDYICRKKELPKNPMGIRTIVSTPLFDVIAKDYGVQVDYTLIGFKYVGEKMEHLGEKFIFGFEEGNGYLVSDFVRDKDGVSTSLLTCQMAMDYKSKGKTLIMALEDLYSKYGYYEEKVLRKECPGEKGKEAMNRLLKDLRTIDESSLSEKGITKKTDYLLDETGLPKSNILEYFLKDGSKIIIRSSGTEPILKMYLFGKGKSREEAKEKVEVLEQLVEEIGKIHSLE